MTSPSSLPYLPASLCGTACLCLVTIALLSLVIVVLSSIFSALAPVLSITVSLQRHKKQIFLWGSNKKEKKNHTPRTEHADSSAEKKIKTQNYNELHKFI